jgi:hypothetical protein
MALKLRTSREEQEARIGRIEQGHKAVQASAIVGPYVAEEIGRINEAMIARYRDPEATADGFYGYAAELTALRNLIERIESDRRRGVVALEQEVSDAEAPTDA